jgi:hypothetical protein
MTAATLSACSNADWNGADETFHHDPEKSAAMAQEQEQRVQAQDAYSDQFGGKDPYTFYRDKGYSDAKARELANEAGPPP